MELCVPGGWVQNNFGEEWREFGYRSVLLAMNCVVFGDCAPNVHRSKKMRSTPGKDAKRAMSLCVDMST
eukprot:3005763-Pleurochrysis_carterae.AAC.1